MRRLGPAPSSTTLHACALGVLVLLASGCSRGFESRPLGLRYTPPSGMALEREEVGPPGLVRFGDGLELRSVPGAPPALERASIETILQRAGVEPAGPILNAQEGSLSAGKVLRFELGDRNDRELYYVVPREARFVLVRFRAPLDRYGQLSAKVERSLSTLQVD